MLKFYGLTGGVVAFESGGKTHRFGIQLEKDEAAKLFRICSLTCANRPAGAGVSQRPRPAR